VSKRSSRQARRGNKARFLKKYAPRFARLIAELTELASYSSIGIVVVDSMDQGTWHWSNDPDWTLVQFEAKSGKFYDGGRSWINDRGVEIFRTPCEWTDLSINTQSFILSTKRWFPFKPKTPLQLLADCAG